MIVSLSINNKHNSINDHSLQPSNLLHQNSSISTDPNTMAGAAFIEALGLVGTGLGIIQFGMDHLAPSAKDPQGTVVAIKGGNGIEKGASNTLVRLT